MIMKRKFYHVYTKGLESDIIFRDREDYIVGMNYVALCTFCCKVGLLAFTLMSNHFHFIIYGTEEEANRFIYWYKSYISRYIRMNHGSHKLLRHVKTGVKLIEDSTEALRIAIAYVLKNHIKASIDVAPHGYEWCSGNCYFTDRDILAGTRSVAELGGREYRRVIRSRTVLDPSFRINSSGYIEPASYIRKDMVEAIFGRVQSFNFHMNTAVAQRSKESPVDFSDSLVLAGLKEILVKKYDIDNVKDLNDLSKKDIALLLKRQFNCPPKQLARLMRINLNEIQGWLA